MAEEKNSIFDLADKFDYQSPFSNWENRDFKGDSESSASIIEMNVFSNHPLIPPLKFLPQTAKKTHVNVMVVVKILIDGIAEKVEINCSNGQTVIARPKFGTSLFEGFFNLLISKSFAAVNEKNEQVFTFTAKVTDVFSRKVSDTRSIRITVDTEGQIKQLIFEIDDTKECFCKKTIWSADDLKYLVSELRKKQDVLAQTQYDERGNPLFIDKNGNILKSNDRGKSPKEGAVKYKKETSFYDRPASDGIAVGDRLFYLKSDENIKSSERNYVVLVQWMNYLFKEIKAIKCINKIHILCQIYHETQRLGSTYESDSSAKKSGEDFYRGRGLIMITKKDNYKSFYKFLYGKDPTESELKEFVPKLASSTEMTAKSTAWYLNNIKIQKYFNDDNVNNVSAAINYPKALTTKNYSSINGLDERKYYFDLIKEVLNYDKCK